MLGGLLRFFLKEGRDELRLISRGKEYHTVELLTAKAGPAHYLRSDNDVAQSWILSEHTHQDEDKNVCPCSLNDGVRSTPPPPIAPV